ncbi:MAG: hypothetical protein JRD04_06705 [Deltaproteobacteria bacterium]|nr:hypothetical protein [Deltaproteobacteria bacterium]
MKFKYSVSDSTQSEFDSLPRVTLSLYCKNRQAEVSGLVDSGATINVLPYHLGIQLGEIWDDRKAYIKLAGSLDNATGIPLALNATIGDFKPVRLAFAWVKSDDIPLILGQTNFFMEFDVCFYRSKLEFEIMPKSP